MHPTFPYINHGPPLTTTAPPTSEDVELAMAINASLQSLTHERPPVLDAHPSTGSNPSTSRTNTTPAPAPHKEEAGPSTNLAQTTLGEPTPALAPSAPPISVIDDGPIQYPSIDSGPIDISARAEQKKEDGGSGGSSSCVICLDAPVQGACIPCGHMAGCMSCLNEIKAKKWGCPVCRAKINQVIRLYAV